MRQSVQRDDSEWFGRRRERTRRGDGVMADAEERWLRRLPGSYPQADREQRAGFAGVKGVDQRRLGGLRWGWAWCFLK